MAMRYGRWTAWTGMRLWLADVVSRCGRPMWLADVVGRCGCLTDVVGRYGWQCGPVWLADVVGLTCMGLHVWTCVLTCA